MADQPSPKVRIVSRGHLGGYVAADENYPNGDPLTFVPAVWRYLIDRYDVKNAVSFGSGEGHCVQWLLENGVDAHGIEGLEDGIRAFNIRCPHYAGRIVQHDYTKGPYWIGENDLIWSCEFVEHVEEKFMHHYLRSGFSRGRVVAMTHAFPGQKGHWHVLLRRADFWIQRLLALGFILDNVAIEESRKLAPESHWARSGMVFIRRAVV